MKKASFISHEDWERMGAKLKASHETALDMYTMLANSLGRSHPVTKKALTAYRKTACLESDLRNLAEENAGSVSGEKEINSLFP